MTTVQSDPSADTQGVSAKPVPDTGLMCLCSIVTYHQVAVDPAQVRHQYGNESEPFNDTNILRAAQTLGFRARAVESTFERLNNSLLPAIASTHDGQYFIILKVIDDNGVPKAVVRFLDESSNKTLDKEVLDSLWNGQLILLTRRGGWAKTLQQHFDIRWFIPSFVKYRKLFGEVIVASFFLQLFALVLPVFFQVVTDKVLVHRGYTTLDVLAVGFLVVAIFDALLSGIRNYTFAHTTNRVDVELGAKLYNHLLGLPLAYFESRQVGQSVARVRELDSIRNFITGTGLTLVIDLFFTFVFFILMWYYSPALTCVVLGTIPFFVILSIFITPILRHRLDEKFKHGAANQSFLVESITGVETVKAMAVEPQMQRRWEDQLAKYVSSAFRVQSLSNVANQIAGFLNKIMTLGIIWYGAHLVMDGLMSVGQLVAFNMLAGRVSGPILKLVNLWQDFQQASISVARLGDILNTPREPGFNPNRSSLPELKGKIEFEHVKFRYRSDGPAILDDVSFTIKPGEVIGVVGKSGSGKSTVAKLIQRLYIPEAGRVMVDGVDLATMDTTFLRQNIGVVLQENFLMNRTVRENISLRNAGLPMEMVVNAAKLAGAHEFIAELPEAYDTMVGEHGSNLSGGQRQRIAIARALISNPRILLFDEATSALDYESERVIQDNMRHICHSRTVFIIAHRLSTVRQADRIIVMERGRIIEQGSHDELLALNGYYAKLNSYQNESPPIRPAPVTPPPGSTAPRPTVTASREGLVKLVQRSKVNPDKSNDETPA